MQNTNRSNSFKNIELEFFAKTYPNQPIKMTISEATLPYIFEGVRFCHEKGFKINANLAYGIDWSNEENVNVLESQLLKLIKYYIDNPELQPCSLLNGEIKSVSYYKDKNIIPKWCGAGSHMYAYDTDGKMYPCHFFMPNTIQNVKLENISPSLQATEVNCSDLPIECQSCCIRSCCPTCYGANYLESKDLFVKNKDYCKLTKIIIRARAYLLAKKWQLGLLKLNNIDEQMTLNSILIINSELKI